MVPRDCPAIIIVFTSYQGDLSMKNLAIILFATMGISINSFAAETIMASKGSTVLYCESAAYAWQAIGKLNDTLVKNPNPLVFNSWDSTGTLISVAEPYAVSSPFVGVYDKGGTTDIACVTVTKQ